MIYLHLALLIIAAFLSLIMLLIKWKESKKYTREETSMNNREKFKKETGEDATYPVKGGNAFCANYTEWLEIKLSVLEAENKKLKFEIFRP